MNTFLKVLAVLVLSTVLIIGGYVSYQIMFPPTLEEQFEQLLGQL